jgi:putative ABC transport system permease protein
VFEATISIVRHPARSLGTAIGTLLGAAAFVSTLGLTSTIQHQVAESFDVRRATEVVVSPESQELSPDWQRASALQRLRGLNGVVEAGRRVDVGEFPLSRSRTGATVPVPVLGADADALKVLQPHITVGRTYGGFHERTAAPVVLLSRGVAENLNIGRAGVAVFIEGRPFTVIGVYDDVARRTEVLLGVLVPAASAERLAGSRTAVSRDVVIATAPGAAQLIGGQAPLALWPTEPDALRVTAPPDPRTLRREVEGNVGRSTLLLSVVSLIIGTFTIGNAAAAAMNTRTPEIGLRRAVGARPRHVFAQLMAETTAIGTLGSVVGALLGVGVTAAVSLAQGWVPVIDLRAALIATVAGAASGSLAGFWPATQAVRVQPVAALQR